MVMPPVIARRSGHVSGLAGNVDVLAKDERRARGSAKEVQYL
jgi:hypothetical protein